MIRLNDGMDEAAVTTRPQPILNKNRLRPVTITIKFMILCTSSS
jgi:hypothetical protein